MKTNEMPKPKNDKVVKMTPKVEKLDEVGALKAQVAKLEAALKNQPQSLTEKIEFFKAKEGQIKKLSVLDKYAEDLVKELENVNTGKEEDDFYTEKYFLKVTHKQGGYRDEIDVLRVQHPVVIAEVIEFAIGKINEKREVLKAAIEA